MLRLAVSDTVAALVDRAGGLPVMLPDRSVARVTFRSRHLIADTETPFARRFLQELRPEMTVLDVGACVGAYTLMAARHVKRVIAFEPVEANVRLLRRNLLLSRLNNVEVLQTLVTNKVGSVLFHQHNIRARGPYGLGSLAPLPATVPAQMPCTTIDALNVRPHLLKIDVEGAEATVIEGARATIQNMRPVILLEVHHARLAALGGSPARLCSTLRQLGYTVENLSEYAADEHTSHWVCSPAT